MAFVTNNSFVEQVAFDGVRTHLAADFDTIYILDLGGNVRKNPKLSGTAHNVFGIQVGVSINLLIRKRTEAKREVAKIYYSRLDEYWRRERKYQFLEEKQVRSAVEWQVIHPDNAGNWITQGIESEFSTFLPIASKGQKSGAEDSRNAIFDLFSLGVVTNRDAYTYSFSKTLLAKTVETYVDMYNRALAVAMQREEEEVLDLVEVDDPRIKWTRQVIAALKGRKPTNIEPQDFRSSAYRPFTMEFLLFNSFWNEEQYKIRSFFPAVESEAENRLICFSAIGNPKPFHCLMVAMIPNLHLTGDSQCVGFYTYAEDGTNRRENITDWALEQFRSHYNDPSITKWDIFHYVYAVLHHPDYRERYAANLRRELPRIPFALASSAPSAVKDSDLFKILAKAGLRLAEIHVHYEQQAEYPLTKKEKAGERLDYRVTKMRLSKDKTSLIYNQFLTLSGIPKETYDYRLGNRSALEWVIDQYQVSTDKRSGITNDPNRPDDPQYILRLISQVVTVSLETVKIVAALPSLGLPHPAD